MTQGKIHILRSPWIPQDGYQRAQLWETKELGARDLHLSDLVISGCDAACSEHKTPVAIEQGLRGEKFPFYKWLTLFFFFKSNLGIWTKSLSILGLTLKESLQKWLRELIWAKQIDGKRGGSEKKPGCGSCMSRPLWIVSRAVNTDAGLTHGRACGPGKHGWIMRQPQRLHKLNAIM